MKISKADILNMQGRSAEKLRIPCAETAKTYFSVNTTHPVLWFVIAG